MGDWFPRAIPIPTAPMVFIFVLVGLEGKFVGASEVEKEGDEAMNERIRDAEDGSRE